MFRRLCAEQLEHRPKGGGKFPCGRKVFGARHLLAVGAVKVITASEDDAGFRMLQDDTHHAYAWLLDQCIRLDKRQDRGGMVRVSVLPEYRGKHLDAKAGL